MLFLVTKDKRDQKAKEKILKYQKEVCVFGVRALQYSCNVLSVIKMPKFVISGIIGNILLVLLIVVHR